MFHWICPECGREIAPTIRECPACDPVAAAVETALAGEVEASARAGQEAVAPAMSPSSPVAGTEPEPAALQPFVPVDSATAVLAHGESTAENAAPEHIAAEHSVADVAQASAALIPSMPSSRNGNHQDTKTAAEDAAPPALATRVQSKSPAAARNSRNGTRHDVKEESLLPQFGAESAAGDPMGHLSSMVDSMREPSPPEPPLSEDALPLPLRAAPNVPASLRAFIAELGPTGAEPRLPVAPTRQHRTAPEPPLFTKSMPLPLRAAKQPHEPPLGAKLLALPVELQQEVRLSTPASEPAPPLAPLGNYSPLEGRPLRPAIPTVQLLKKECGPRTTLPGPMLTRRLVKFLDREFHPIPPAFLRVKKPLIPGWMATALIMGTLLGAGLTSIVTFVRPTAEAKPSVSVQTSAPAVPVASTPDVSSAAASPLAKGIEVTGFRIQMDPAKKSEIQYLVVNHTPTRFADVTVYVTLYAADAKAGQPPLCRFQFAAPNLAPYQAKDMTSSIERATRPVSLPDWQDLRASVEIGQ